MVAPTGGLLLRCLERPDPIIVSEVGTLGGIAAAELIFIEVLVLKICVVTAGPLFFLTDYIICYFKHPQLYHIVGFWGFGVLGFCGSLNNNFSMSVGCLWDSIYTKKNILQCLWGSVGLQYTK